VTSSCRSAAWSSRPRASAVYRLPWLRPKHGSRLRWGTELTGASAHRVASVSSNSASAQLLIVACSAWRNLVRAAACAVGSAGTISMPGSMLLAMTGVVEL
jgi:hypothetical protein